MIVQDAVNALISSGRLNPDINIDRNYDGVIDNMMIVVPCESGNTNTLFYGLYKTYSGVQKINNKSVAGYNIITESGAYLSIGQSGLPIHEYMHSLGYPDLYRTRASWDSNTNNPVYTWDIMSNENMYLQYPLAYNRMAVSNSFSITELTESKEDCSLYSVSKATPFSNGTENLLVSSDLKNNQALILKTAYSDTEFFVVEYRKVGDTKMVPTGDGIQQKWVDAAYDRKIPGSGLVIYRVNLGTERHSNMTDGPYYIYVFRPGDSFDSNGIEKGEGDINNSYLSEESGRTSYGTEDLSKGLSDNAITYSDGQNSGIVISNVGATSGDQISFSVTIPKMDVDKNWKTEYATSPNSDFVGSISTMDKAGKIYTLSYTYGAGSLFKSDNEVMDQLPNSTINGYFYGWDLVEYGNYIYAAFTDANSGKVRLAKWNGGEWQNIWTSPNASNGGDICADETGVYIVTASADSDRLDCFKYDGNKMVSLGTVADNCKYAANPKITVSDGCVFVAYSEFINGGKAYIKKYQENQWSDLGNINLSSDYHDVMTDGEYVYFGRALNTYGGVKKLDMWKCSSDESSAWQQVGTDIINDETIADLKLSMTADGVPYVALYASTGNSLRVYAYKGEAWNQVGANVANEYIPEVSTYYHDGKIWVSYLSTGLHKTLCKCIIFEDSADEIKKNRVSNTSLTLNGEIGLNFYTELSPKVKYVRMTSAKGIDKKVYINDAVKTSNGSNTAYPEYRFIFNVAAKEMGDAITIAPYDSYGNIVPLTNESCTDGKLVYSVNDYIDYVLDEENGYELSNPDLYSLCCAMKKYGNNSQVYFGYNSNELSMIESPTADVNSFAPIFEGNVPEGLKYFGSSLLLESGTCIRHYFELAKGYSVEDYTFFTNDKKINPSLCEDDNNMCYVQIDNIPAPLLNQTYLLRIKKNNCEGEYKISYSVFGYIYKAQLGNNGRLKTLCDSLYEYQKNAARLYWGRS